MKTPKILAVAALGLASLAMTSCEDWLTIYPQNKLTDEQFWEDANDLEGVRYAAYRNFASEGVVRKILAWGELRSDNVVFANMSNSNDFNEMLRITDGRLDTASGFNDWGSFYTTINYCNQVIFNGDKVVERDPQFSTAQWTRIKAEMIALRALNYFYLVRAFGNVPYVNKLVKNDSQVETHRQMLQSEVIDHLIDDVEGIKNDPRLFFSSVIENRSLITRPFTHTLLADLYMWRGAKYEGEAANGNAAALENAKDCYYKAYKAAKEARRLMDDDQYGQYHAIYKKKLSEQKTKMGPFYLTQSFQPFSSSEKPTMDAFFELFARQNSNTSSDEVIFEMPFTQNDNQKCTIFRKYFGVVSPTSNVTFYSNYSGLRLCCPQSDEKNRFLDLRLVYSCAYNDDNNFDGLTQMGVSPHGNGYMMKYHEFDKSSNYFNIVGSDPQYTVNYTYNDYHSFIVYRKSDVLFIQAEATALLKKHGFTAFEGTDNIDAMIKEAQDIIAEHRRRSYYKQKDYTGSLTAEYVTSKDNRWTKATTAINGDSLLAAVLDEKQIEFVGEAKRWFDIVRYMERKGATKEAINEMFTPGRNQYSMYKHDARAARYKSNLRARWAFYNPVYYPERESSGYKLYQNPFWDDDPTNDDPASGETEEAFLTDDVDEGVEGDTGIEDAGDEGDETEDTETPDTPDTPTEA